MRWGGQLTGGRTAATAKSDPRRRKTTAENGRRCRRRRPATPASASPASPTSPAAAGAAGGTRSGAAVRCAPDRAPSCRRSSAACGPSCCTTSTTRSSACDDTSENTNRHRLIVCVQCCTANKSESPTYRNWEKGLALFNATWQVGHVGWFSTCETMHERQTGTKGGSLFIDLFQWQGRHFVLPCTAVGGGRSGGSS